MHIHWHGQYTVKIQSGEQTLILDPYAPSVGLPPLRSKASIVALTHPSDPSQSHVSGLQGEWHLIDSPGEYSLPGFTVQAIGWHDEAGHERSLHRWQIEDMVVLHLGALNRDLTDAELQEIEMTEIDILLVPVGGGGALTTKQALAVVSQIEPRLVIPIHFMVKGVKEKLDTVDRFARELGASPKDVQEKAIVKKSKLPAEEMATIILKS